MIYTLPRVEKGALDEIQQLLRRASEIEQVLVLELAVIDSRLSNKAGLEEEGRLVASVGAHLQESVRIMYEFRKSWKLITASSRMMFPN